MKNVLVIVSLLFASVVASAQDTGTVATTTVESNPVSILLLVNEAKPNHVIVYDVSGKWLSDVRSLRLNVDLMGDGIVAECIVWRGALRPTNPKSFKVTVKEIKSVDAGTFADRLARLNRE